MTLTAIGSMRRRLTLEAPARIGDEAGSATTTWSSLGDVWGALTPRSGREIADADGLSARIDHELEIRWRNDITATMRFRDGATVYVVHAVKDDDTRRRRLICLVEEIAP
jgi:SPP1 family predicted phage head-tail adaptor